MICLDWLSVKFYKSLPVFFEGVVGAICCSGIFEIRSKFGWQGQSQGQRWATLRGQEIERWHFDRLSAPPDPHDLRLLGGSHSCVSWDFNVPGGADFAPKISKWMN